MSYDLATSSRRCARTGRELQPGERYLAVLYERDGHLVREDLSPEAWTTPPEEAFAWWQAKVPAADTSNRLVIDDGLVYDCFIRLEGNEDEQKINFRYVLALWLLRKRKLKFDEIRKEAGRDWLHLRETKAKKIHRVADPHLNEEAIASVQDEVEAMLRAA
jgi:hypothetical protein